MLWGTGDRFVAPSYAAIFTETIPQARLVMIEEAGHLIGLERPDPYAQAVCEWGRGAAMAPSAEEPATRGAGEGPLTRFDRSTS